MRRAITILAVIPLIGNTDPPDERVVAGDGVVTVRLGGKSLRLRVDPAAPGMPLLSERVAEDLGFRKRRSFGIGYGFRIGPTTIMSDTGVSRIDYGSKPIKQRFGWTRRPFANVADGSIGPGALPEPIVRFVLRPAQPGERTITMKMQQVGFPTTLFGDGWMPSIGVVEVAGAPMRIRFDPHHPHTLATAGAAVRLAKAYGGRLSGASVPTEIFFGVDRPVRGMTLDRPLIVGPLSIGRLGVRLGDFGNADTIRDGDKPPPVTDPDEILVTAKGRKRDARHDTISIGADQLRRCSSIVFDKRLQEIRLTCATAEIAADLMHGVVEWRSALSPTSPSAGISGHEAPPLA